MDALDARSVLAGKPLPDFTAGESALTGFPLFAALFIAGATPQYTRTAQIGALSRSRAYGVVKRQGYSLPRPPSGIPTHEKFSVTRSRFSRGNHPGLLGRLFHRWRRQQGDLLPTGVLRDGADGRTRTLDILRVKETF